jgi:hypothetical protein
LLVSDGDKYIFSAQANCPIAPNPQGKKSFPKAKTPLPLLKKGITAFFK